MAGTAASAARAQTSAVEGRRGRRALVFSGGGARGAYEAGVIAALAARAGVSDGQPLPYDLVAGTSIGALNAYCVATAQYSRLRQAWLDIARLDVVRLKPQFAPIPRQSSGVLTRIAAALGLTLGLTKNVTGVLDGSGVASFLGELIEPSDPVAIPFYFASTNLSRLRGELFVRRATTPDGLVKQRANDALLASNSRLVLRTVDDALLRSALFASASIPLAFDPVLIPSPEGTLDQYVDGGVTYNVPVSIANACADQIDGILVDPPVDQQPDVRIDDGVDVGLAVFQTMQRSILAYQVRAAYFESAAENAYAAGGAGASPPGGSAGAAVVTHAGLSAGIIRPSHPLPGSVLSFGDGPALEAMWERGYADGSSGFTPYTPDPREII